MYVYMCVPIITLNLYLYSCKCNFWKKATQTSWLAFAPSLSHFAEHFVNMCFLCLKANPFSCIKVIQYKDVFWNH